LGDHLGSTDTITDAAGVVVERMSFDAWGKRRETDWVPIVDPTTYEPVPRRLALSRRSTGCRAHTIFIQLAPR
jgi:hypothetical protein